MVIDVSEKTLHFKQPAGTSRGIYTTRKSWFVTITDADDPSRTGVGECAPLPLLSCDAIPGYADVLGRACRCMERTGEIPYEELADYPSMLFGLETAEKHLRRGSFALFDTPFSRSQASIPINGLVWMGTYSEMLRRMEEKLCDGFRCIKLKIGAIDFDSELDLLRRIRGSFSPADIELRVDANGAFSAKEALEKLEALAPFAIHSIEQPIRAGQWEAMAQLCRKSPIPIALDEELIGVNRRARKDEMLEAISPAYIILKPSLHGGMRGCEEWIALARQRGIGSWVTSALESNIGLNAIAQFTAKVYGPEVTMPQGLGTGSLFTDNVELPYTLSVSRGALSVVPIP